MSKRKEERSGQFVTPGDKLGVIEEFLPGRGTFVKDGLIYSLITGHALVDIPNKIISVYPRVRPPILPYEGSIVIGQVSNTQEKSVSVRILKIGKRDVPGVFTGIIHISTASEDYIKTMYDAFKPGDIVRARVVSDKNMTYHLSTVDKSLGVLFAFCSRCGFPLSRKGDILQCQVCKNIESRKIAEDYGTGEI
ncbi:exosome complex RNA-binding protein Csl4 [Candidatus Bathyarchaeota archaeon]|nr:exosome complex RNA-binding protein Csl4 [Candidatus Bathyarchaeota archaeon]